MLLEEGERGKGKGSLTSWALRPHPEFLVAFSMAAYFFANVRTKEMRCLAFEQEDSIFD